MKTRFIVTAALAVLLSGGLTLQVVAQDAATTLKNRQEAMKGFGGNMKAINEFVEKGVGTPADVEAKAGAIEEGSKQIVALFPAGTGMDDGVGKTGAKKEIWDKPDDFKAAADKMGMLAGKLEEAAATGDKQQIADAFGALGKKAAAAVTRPSAPSWTDAVARSLRSTKGGGSPVGFAAFLIPDSLLTTAAPDRRSRNPPTLRNWSAAPISSSPPIAWPVTPM